MGTSSLFTIFKREFRSYFLSPVAYIVITVFLVATGSMFFLTGWFSFGPFFIEARADLRNFFTLLPWIFSLTIPAITMRLISEEIRSGSYEILLTLPVTVRSILIGKFLSALAFVVVMLLPTLAYPLFISNLGELDWGPVVGGYVGAILLAASFISIGILSSALSKNQIVAFIIGLAICMFLILVDKILLFFPTFLTGFFQFIGADYHFSNITKGIVDSRDVIYFVSMGFLALYTTYLVIEQKK